MKKKGFILVSIFLLLTLVLSACGSNSKSSAGSSSNSQASSSKSSSGSNNSSSSSSVSSTSNSTSKKQPYIAIVSKGFQQEYWQYVEQGAKQAAQKYNMKMTFVGPDNESQVDQQVNMLRTAIGKNPDAIGIAALDSKAVIPLLQQEKAKNVPIIAFDSGVSGNIPDATAATDNKKAAATAADHMAKLIGNSGEVGIVCHDQTSLTGVNRRDGFVNEIKSKYPNIKIVEIQYAGGDPLKSADAAKAIMQSHPKLKGLFGTNEGSAIGVVNAVKELHKQGKIVVVGFDSGQQQIDAINNGVEQGAITQNPVGIGYQTVEAAYKLLNGQSVPKMIDTGFYWYDKSNITDPKIKGVLYH